MGSPILFSPTILKNKNVKVCVKLKYAYYNIKLTCEFFDKESLQCQLIKVINQHVIRISVIAFFDIC